MRASMPACLSCPPGSVITRGVTRTSRQNFTSETSSSPAYWCGPRGLHDQPLIRLRRDRIAADPVAGPSPVVVTSARCEQAESAGQGAESHPFLMVVIGMPDLDPG